MAKAFAFKPHAGAVDDASIVADEVDVFFGTPIEEQLEITVSTETGEIEPVDEEKLEKMELLGLAFNANLAQAMSEEDLDEIGTDVLELVKSDLKTREKWYDTLKKGLDRLGIYTPEMESDSVSGVTKVTHPLLLEAATQFQARAMAELLPPGGPVKTQVVGVSDEATEAQGLRVSDYMNYQLVLEDRTYYDERDQMLFLLAFTGSEFDKQYYDAASRKVVSRWVRCDDFIVPYNAQSLQRAPRYTHVIRMTGAALRAQMATGFYLDVDLGDPVDTDTTEAPLTKKLAELDGQEKPVRIDSDKEYAFYEVHIDYDIEGLTEAAPMPFTITVDSESGKTLSIYRNWREADTTAQKRVWFTHKKFLPGFGFYGFGLLHCIGNLSDGASEILRILIDSGAFATLQGGFKSVDAKLKGDVVLQPGIWNDTEMTAEELARAFYTPPWKEPSDVLVKLLGMITDLGQRFAATTETMVGDAATTGPVGTMVAQIEQGSKVFSGIHKRLHKGFGDEFLNIAELNGEHLPDMYPYRTGDAGQNILRSDFDARIDIIPVSDPNIFSSAQRIAMAQTALQMATQMPDLADRREAAVQLLRAMRFTEPEKIFPAPAKAERADPLSEGSLMLMGRPLKAYVDQDHPSHITVHMGQLQGLPPQFAPLMQAHLFEHMGMEQWKKFASMGLPLPPVKWDARKNEPMLQPLPPPMEAQLAVASAQAMQQVMQQLQQQAAQQQPQGGGADPAQAAAHKDAAFQQTQQQKDAAFQNDQARKDASAAATVDRQDALEGLSPTLVKQAQEFITQTGVQMSPRELAMLSKALGKPFTDVVAAVSRLMMQGSGGSQFPQAAELHANNPRFK